MSSVQLVITTEDIPTISRSLTDVGLSVLLNKRYEKKADVALLPADVLLARDRASAYLTKREWIFDEFLIDTLSNSKDGSVYIDLRPRVNFAALAMSYYSTNSAEPRRLGFGDIVSYRSWLKMPEKQVRSAPRDTHAIYNALITLLSRDGKLIKTDRGHVLVMAAAFEKFLTRQLKMPHSRLDGLM